MTAKQHANNWPQAKKDDSMKYLREYTEEATTAALDKAGAFFAFSNQQLDEKKREGVQYVNLGAGLICPKANADQLAMDLDAALDSGIAADLAENGRKGVIHRELGNHEYSYTYDISDTVSALGGYGITAEDVQSEARAYLDAFEKWEDEQEAKTA